MRILFTALVLIIANYATAQQVNPVPDYVFSNRMSVGRNAVTDTAAYFSIGPRYGANKGFMPPIVGDTAHVTASNKRNGLLIFSVQKNKFLYWDSVRVRWSDMAGSSGSYIVAGDTATMLSPYVRHAGYGLTKSGQSFLVDTAAIATRARVQKGIDSVSSFVVKLTGNQTIAGNKTFSNDATFSGNINLFGALAAFNELNTAYTSYLKSRASAVSQFLYLPGDTGNLATERFVNSKFTSTVSGTTNYVPKFTSSTVLGNSQIFDNGTNVGIGTATPISGSVLDVTGSTNIYPRIRSTGTGEAFQFYQNSNSGTTAGDGLFVGINSGNDAFFYNAEATPARFFTSGSERMRITSDGNVGIGTASPSRLLDIQSTSSSAVFRLKGGTSNDQGSAIYYTFAGSTSTYMAIGDRAAIFGGKVDSLASIFTNSTIPLIFDIGASEKARFNTSGELLIGTTTDAGAYALQVAGAIYNTTTITTGAPTSGTAKPWRLGEAATVSPTSPNRTIRVEIEGTVYYIHAKTTND